MRHTNHSYKRVHVVGIAKNRGGLGKDLVVLESGDKYLHVTTLEFTTVAPAVEEVSMVPSIV